MFPEGKVQFLQNHGGSVRGVAFHPTDRYLFCSGAYDGLVNLYSAKEPALIKTFHITAVSLVRNINAVRFSLDGTKILCTSTSRRMTVMDVERGLPVQTYDNCAYNGRDRIALSVDPSHPNYALCTCVNGKGLSLFDLRSPMPSEILYDLHLGVIRDAVYIDGDWPWCHGSDAIVTASSDGISKVITRDGRVLHIADLFQTLTSVAKYPGPFDREVDDGFYSMLMYGGNELTSYVPHIGVMETLPQGQDVPVWRVRYNSSGSKLYTTGDDGSVRHYLRTSTGHRLLGDLFLHKGDVEDMDISPYDEYIVTASQDKSVGLMKLGMPNHGSTNYYELT